MVRHTITMPESMSEYISWQVTSGDYGGMSEYFRDLVRRDQEKKQASILALRNLVDASEASGISSRSLNDIWEDCKDRATKTSE